MDRKMEEAREASESFCEAFKGFEMPEMTFRPGTNVQPLLPRSGAMYRMLVNGYSVYLDIFDSLGCYGSPYWECYDGQECYRFNMSDWAAMLEQIYRFDDDPEWFAQYEERER